MYVHNTFAAVQPDRIAPPAPLPAQPPIELLARTMLIWREHCIECAAPDCYATCDLYQPTPLGGCRRFENGIEPIAGTSRPMADISFKRWGKLEARGSAIPLSPSAVTRIERQIGRASWLLDRVERILTSLDWTDRVWRLVERAGESARNRLDRVQGLAATPDAFVAEIYNPGQVAIRALLSIVVDHATLAQTVDASELPRPFRRSLDIVPGDNLFEVPGGEFAPILASGLPFLVQLTIDGNDGGRLVFGMLDFVWQRTAELPKRISVPSDRPQAKCVVFDLDNTLWEGVLLEGEVTLRPGVAELFRRLDKRGVLLSVASKNAESDALTRLREAGLDDYLLAPQIGWEPKSASLERIASMLDIGLDTLIFVDDNPFERAEVAAVLPVVESLPDTALADLADHPRLAGSVTGESKRRRSLYREAAARESASRQFENYRAFLRDCEIELEIRPDRADDFERIVELVQRTNQLNFSGRKYTRKDIGRILEDPERRRFIIAAQDRFGSYGTVGFCLARREEDTIEVEDLMLSCRIQGKYVEQALFDYLTKAFSDPFPSRMHVDFRPTERNAAALRVLDALGFEEMSDGGYARAISPGDLAVDFMTVNG